MKVLIYLFLLLNVLFASAQKVEKFNFTLNDKQLSYTYTFSNQQLSGETLAKALGEFIKNNFKTRNIIITQNAVSFKFIDFFIERKKYGVTGLMFHPAFSLIEGDVTITVNENSYTISIFNMFTRLGSSLQNADPHPKGYLPMVYQVTEKNASKFEEKEKTNQALESLDKDFQEKFLLK